MNKRLIFNGLALFFSLLAACENNFLIEKKLPVQGENWTYADSLRFEFEVTDTSKLYNLFVDFDHASSFPTENIYVRIGTVFPSGKRLLKQRSFLLAGPTGDWLGDCSSGKCSIRIPLQESTFFQETGKYTLIFEQWMRQDSLPGVRAVGLAVEKTEAKK